MELRQPGSVHFSDALRDHSASLPALRPATAFAQCGHRGAQCQESTPGGAEPAARSQPQSSAGPSSAPAEPEQSRGSRWAFARGRKESLVATGKALHADEAWARHVRAKELANECWSAESYETCLAHLNESLSLMSRCDVLHRYRAQLHGRRGDAARR